jgi:hypothetical protein
MRNTCPSTPPADGSACDGANAWCYFQDCAGAGQTLTTCTNGRWVLTNAPCPASHACVAIGQTFGSCAGSQLCSISENEGISSICDAVCGTLGTAVGPVSPCGCPNQACVLNCQWYATAGTGLTKICSP